MDPVEHERVFPVAAVCSVTTPDGAGNGILCTLKDAPCVLTPAHVLGSRWKYSESIDSRGEGIANAAK